VREVADKPVGQDSPVAPRDKVGHFQAEEVLMLVGRGMAATLHHAVEVLERPWGRVGDHRGAVGAEVVQEASGRVLEVLEIGSQLGRATGVDNEGGPVDGGEEIGGGNVD
jgi:hypothetical protein